MIYDGVCRTAPAAQGLLTSVQVMHKYLAKSSARVVCLVRVEVWEIYGAFSVVQVSQVNYPGGKVLHRKTKNTQAILELKNS